MDGQITMRRLAALGASIALLGSPPVAARPAAVLSRPVGPRGCGACRASTPKVDPVVMRLTSPRPIEILPREDDHGRAPGRGPGRRALRAPPAAGRSRCPAALGGALRLEFTAGDRSYQPVLIRDSGCASVTGVGPVRQWSWSSLPGRLLGEAVGGYGQLIPGTHPSSVPTP